MVVLVVVGAEVNTAPAVKHSKATLVVRQDTVMMVVVVTIVIKVVAVVLVVLVVTTVALADNILL